MAILRLMIVISFCLLYANSVEGVGLRGAALTTPAVLSDSAFGAKAWAVMAALEDMLGPDGSLVLWNIITKHTEVRYGGDAKVRTCGFTSHFLSLSRKHMHVVTLTLWLFSCFTFMYFHYFTVLLLIESCRFL